MLLLDGVYVEGCQRIAVSLGEVPTSAELTQLAQTIAQRTARVLERQGLLERDAEQAKMALRMTTRPV